MAKRKYKKEWVQAVASYHERILQRLKLDKAVAIHQESYKSLYFSIFQEAYESGFCAPLSYNLRSVKKGYWTEWIHTKPMVSGDSIWNYAKEQGWVHSEMKGTENRYKQIDTVRTWWNEWTYAWHGLGHKTRRYRTIENAARS